MPLTQGHKLDASTIALWRLDETSGGASDVSGNGYTLATNGATVPPSASGLIADGGKARGPFTGAKLFKTANDTIAAMLGEITAEAWITLDPSWSVGGTVTGFYLSTGDTFRLAISTARQVTMTWHAAASTPSYADATVLGTGTRFHVAGRRRSIGGGNYVVDIFVNGAKMSTSGSLAAADVSTSFWSVGGHTTAGDTFNGVIDDVRVSTVSRTDAEIADSYWRGLLDTSPGPTVAPFRQTRTPYQDFHRQLSPTALLNPQGAAFEAAQGALKDAMFDRCLQSVKAKYPSVAPGDALAAIGADRMMPRGGSEADAAYAARLLNAWNTWPWAGTAYGLLQAFFSTGYRNVVLAQVRGGKQFTLDNGGVNLAVWSQQFEKWSTHGGGQQNGYSTPSADTTAAPDGTITADTISTTASTPGNGFAVFEDCVLGANGQYTFSVWLRSGTASSAQIFIKDCASDTIRGTTTCALTSAWQRFSVTGTTSGGTLGARIEVQVNVATGTVVAWGAQLEPGSAVATYSITYAANKPTALPAGSLLTSTMASGIWETDPLSSYSPASQSFWSKFDVLFPLPLMPPSWGWAGGIPGSSSTEANFIRSLIKAWAPAHATCDRIVIVQQGGVFGYPAPALWGASNGLWGSSSNTVWVP